MTPLETIRAVRLEKLRLLKEAGMDGYPSASDRDCEVAAVLDMFQASDYETRTVKIAGRIFAVRAQGALIFFEINDGSAKIQGLVEKDSEIAPNNYFKLFFDAVDVGDIVQIEGTLFCTKRGERTVRVKTWKMLSKSLLPLPEKWHGIQDPEMKMRYRYLDMLFNPEIRNMIRLKSRFWNSVRSFLQSAGFVEVETPVLENTIGGADARPFVTHHNALDIDVYLRISCGELWQKRLLVGGFQKTFEIGRIFRNEGISSEHAQDYTQMEFYWAYANYKDGMKFVEDMYRIVAQETFGTTRFKIGEFDVDLAKSWEIYDYVATIEEKTGVNVGTASLSEIEMALKKLHISFDGGHGWNRSRAIDGLWKHCRRMIAGPGFLVGVPKELSPLAKEDKSRPGITERFQPIIAGSELGNGYSELNDPLDQAARFGEQAELREAGDEDAQMYDKDFVEALEHGMPPACGFGMSERVFSFLMSMPIRETQAFPLLRPANAEKPE